jgi:hypothetical protein
MARRAQRAGREQGKGHPSNWNEGVAPNVGRRGSAIQKDWWNALLEPVLMCGIFITINKM